MNFSPEIIELASHVLTLCRDKKLTLATVESCTGGLVSAALTELPGSSDVFLSGLVTYSNEAKSQFADVPASLIAHHGAVSEAVAQAMAIGGLKRIGSSLAIAITGIAGPGGGSPNKPIGTVHIALANSAGIHGHQKFNYGAKTRAGIRQLTTIDALKMILNYK